MIGGFNDPHRAHSKNGGHTVVLTHEFAEHCINAVKAAGENIPRDGRTIGELRIAVKALETAFLRGMSGYDPKSAKAVAQELVKQDESLQRHMYLQYIREDDAIKARYLESHAAMVVMKAIHEKSAALLDMADNPRMPPHLRAVQTEMCWHILEVCESGTDVIADAVKTR